ncbi:MAG TPA: hypothetical protein VNG93_03980 [Candidatus Dormibacteraeota bacterium]|nr:hypothetical protein [Candidatus Dormibacteraeota bacterium]
MSTAENPEMTVEGTDSDNSENLVQLSEPTLLDHWRFERRSSESQPASDWRSSVPTELFERIRARSAAATVQPPAPVLPVSTSAPERVEAAQASLAPLPESYRAPFLPEPQGEPENVVESLGWGTDSDLLPAEPTPVRLPSAFLGLDWLTAEESPKVLVSVRPILDAELAEKVAELLDSAPGMSSVRSLGSDGDVAAFEAEYDGPVDRMEAVSQALRGIGASLVSSGDREFYLAIQGQAV